MYAIQNDDGAYVSVKRSPNIKISRMIDLTLNKPDAKKYGLKSAAEDDIEFLSVIFPNHIFKIVDHSEFSICERCKRSFGDGVIVKRYDSIQGSPVWCTDCLELFRGY